MVLNLKVTREITEILDREGFGDYLKDDNRPSICGSCYGPLIHSSEGSYCNPCLSKPGDRPGSFYPR